MRPVRRQTADRTTIRSTSGISHASMRGRLGCRQLQRKWQDLVHQGRQAELVVFECMLLRGIRGRVSSSS